jgi:DNA replication protein DnaC
MSFLENARNAIKKQIPIEYKPCGKCQEGYIKTPKKEGIGFTFQTCDCLVEYESQKESFELIQNSNIPDRLIMNYKLEEWEDEANLFEIFCNTFCSEELGKNWIFIYGTTGSGKTYASIIGAEVAVLKEQEVYFVNVPELLDSLRPKPDGSLRDENILEKVFSADLLILDDIGQEKASQWVRERLYMIINHRWNLGKPVIFTSNYNIEHIKETISGAVYSRIKGESLEIELHSKVDRRL